MLWKNHLLQQVVGSRMPCPSFMLLNGCQGAGMGMLSLDRGLPRVHPTIPARSRAVRWHQDSHSCRHQAPPWGWNRSLQIGPAQWGPWLGRAVGSWNQSCYPWQPQGAETGSWAGTFKPMSTLGAQTEASPPSKVCHTLQRSGFSQGPDLQYSSRTNLEVVARSKQETRS